MNKTEIIAMYLPQFYETSENNKWWGNGFTDWVCARSAEPLFEGHKQPQMPLNDYYYDLSRVEDIRWQVSLAKKYGVYGFGIYHYWFSSNQRLLVKPAELLLENKDIEMPFFFVWDNCSWVRTWSKLQHNSNTWSPRIDKNIRDENGSSILAELIYGDKSDWKMHFDYLLPFFNDKRYIKIDDKPIFIFFNYNDKRTMEKMIMFWDGLAKENGFAGLFVMSRKNPYDSMPGLQALFTYEPMFSAWQNKNILSRVKDKLYSKCSKSETVTFFDYDMVWKKILDNAKRGEIDTMYGAFVKYDDTPRRGIKGKVVIGESPEKFERYLKELLKISNDQNKKFLFLTAWNEWGEGAVMEPTKQNEYKYLEALKKCVLGESN